MQIFLVGGAVRDALLGLPVQDRDWVVVGSTPEELTRLGYLPVGKDFPVFLHPETKEEYAHGQVPQARQLFWRAAHHYPVAVLHWQA